DAHRRALRAGITNQPRTGGLQRTAQGAREVAVAVGGTHLHPLKLRRKALAPLQLEATGGEQRTRQHDRQQIANHGLAHHTTTLTSLPLTTMTFFGVRCSRKRCTCASATAAARTSSSLAEGDTLMRPRSLPLTCTTTSMASCTSAAGSTARQRVRHSASHCPSSRHS